MNYPTEKSKTQKLTKEQQEIQTASQYLFENSLDFHMFQRIFIELVNQDLIIEQKLEHYDQWNEESILKEHLSKFEDYLSFSLVCKQFNLISKNTLFKINIFENQINFENTKYLIYLKLNYIKTYVILIFNTQLSKKIKPTVLEFISNMLIYSSYHGFYDLIKPLISNGANINYETGFSGLAINSISESCKGGYLKTTKKLIKYKANINWSDNLKNNLLHFACRNTNLNLVKYLIENGLNIQNENKYQKTPLFEACEFGNLKTVKYLISLGSNIHQKSKQKETILIYSCISKNFELIQYLLDLGLNLNDNFSIRKTCIFFTCIQLQDLELAKFLILKGANLKIKYDGKKYKNLLNIKLYDCFKR